MKIYKTEIFSVVIVGGTNVDISLVLKLFVKCTHSSQRFFFQTFFERNTEFLGCRRVDLAYENNYHWDHCIALLFFETSWFVNMRENHEFPRIDLAYL